MRGLQWLSISVLGVALRRVVPFDERFTMNQRSFFRSHLAAGIALSVIVGASIAPVSGREIFLGKRGFVGEDGGEAGPQAQVAEFPDGASLSTDPEVDRKLKRAEEYVAAGRFDNASIVWQEVLDGKTSVLRSTDGRHYTSVQFHVEGLLARTAREAPEGLKEYRVKADAEARQLLAQAKGADEERALADIERRFFYSSLGDDAAYTLGCLMLDRFEFVAATRYFSKILAAHPDYIAKTDTPPSVPRGELMLRLAIAAARSGDGKTAKAVVEELKKPNAGHTAIVAAHASQLTWVDR
jgi:hypothetical protein